jgi:hypothetical protein
MGSINLSFVLWPEICIFTLAKMEHTMSLMNLETETKQEKYLDVLRNLRAKNFSRNLPFLILSNKLPRGQVYKEYADGRIEIQEVSSAGKNFNVRVLKTLAIKEAELVRQDYGLL